MNPSARGRSCDLGRVRVVFAKESYIDLWFERDTLWTLSANYIKKVAHRITSALVREAEGDDAGATHEAGAGARFSTGEQAGPATRGPRITTRTFASLVERRGYIEDGNKADVAYHARLRLCSVVLHFRGKGLRPGAFLFLAVQNPSGADTSADMCSCSSSDGSSSAVGSGVDDTLLTQATTTTGVFVKVNDAFGRTGAGVEAEKRPENRGKGGGGGNGESCLSSALERDSGQAAEVGGDDLPSNGTLPSPTARDGYRESLLAGYGGGGEELWVTDESVPLLPALRGRWASSVAAVYPAGARSCATAGAGNSAGVTALRPPGATGGTRTEAAEEGRGSDAKEEAATGPSFQAALTLQIMPSGRTPLPPLSCGLCGSSWQTDAFGRGYRVYHLAVANNSSLVWYLQKRFSEFLALHGALSGRGGVEEGRIPEDRLPKPPTRTFGLLRLFPEKMEWLRRDQLEGYMQGLLSLPEALANRRVLSFLGLVSSSRHDLMSPPDPMRGRSRTRGQSPSRRTVAPSSTLPSYPATSTPSTRASGDCGNGTGAYTGRIKDRRRGHVGSGESGAPAACDGATRVEQLGVAEATAWAPATEAVYQSPPKDGGPRHACDADKGASVGCREGTTVGEGREAEILVAAKEQVEEVVVMRNVEKVDALEQAAHGGDVVLFQCRGFLSRLQRWVLRSQWDHVGVVVSGGPSGRLELLESTQEGVHLHPLVERVRAYHDQGFASRVAFRRLQCPNPAESRARLEAFARQVEGKTYGIRLPFALGGPSEERSRVKYASFPSPSPSPSPATQPKSPRVGAHPAAIGDGQGGRTADRRREEQDTRGRDARFAFTKEEVALRDATVLAEQGGGKGRDDAAANPPGGEATSPSSSPCSKSGSLLPRAPPPPHPSYLCSQLVGAALSEMGVLRGGVGWLWVIPGAFGQGGAVETGLAAGVTLGEEILVDAHEPEVAGAFLLADALG